MLPIYCVIVAVDLLQLSALFPCEGMSEITYRVALLVVGDSLRTDLSQQVFPLGVTVCICCTVLRLDIAVVVILHRVDNGKCIFIYSLAFLFQKLAERVVGVLKDSVS